MVMGSFIVGACLLTLGWTAEVVGWFVSDPETVCDREEEYVHGAFGRILTFGRKNRRQWHLQSLQYMLWISLSMPVSVQIFC
jgi:hypothetical protein